MLKIGLTGGYATGKSCVARELERLGCRVIYADDLGHAVLEPNGEAYAQTLNAFGPEILDADGSINRKKLGEIVFNSPELLTTLSGFVHPAVIRLEEQIMHQFQAEDPRGIAVVEAAILIETGRDAVFDRIILTVCDEEIQIQRGIKRDQLSRPEVMARMAKQLPVEEKKARADFVIDTSGPKDETVKHVQNVYRELKQLAEARRI